MRTLETETYGKMPLFVEVTTLVDSGNGDAVGLDRYVNETDIRWALSTLMGPSGAQVLKAALEMAELRYFRDQSRDAWDEFKEE